MKNVLVIILVSSVFTGFGQISNPNIDKNDLRNLVRILASDSLEGRGIGTKGHKKAEIFISDIYQNLGLIPFNENSYLQEFELKQRYWNEVYLETSNIKLGNFEQIVFEGNEPLNVEVEKEVVFGGLGTDEELDKIDVEDRFVLIFIDNLRTGLVFRRKLAERKAFGVILANPENEMQFESIRRTMKDHSLAKRYALVDKGVEENKMPSWDTFPSVNGVLIPNDQVKTIMGESIKQLQLSIDHKRIQDIPVQTVKAKFERVQNIIKTANVAGLLKGESDKTIVITAHYDHLGTVGSQLFPGADDNASGTAALLELAQLFSKEKNLRYNLLFLATSAEEAGLLGSEHHVNTKSFQPEDVILNVNMDMIGRKDSKHFSNKYLYCIGSDQSQYLTELLMKADKAYNKCEIDYALNNSKDPLGIFTRSDHYNFYKKGIPSLFFFSGLHSDYHKTTDTSSKINYKVLAHRVNQISKVIELVDNEQLD